MLASCHGVIPSCLIGLALPPWDTGSSKSSSNQIPSCSSSGWHQQCEICRILGGEGDREKFGWWGREGGRGEFR